MLHCGHQLRVVCNDQANKMWSTQSRSSKKTIAYYLNKQKLNLTAEGNELHTKKRVLKRIAQQVNPYLLLDPSYLRERIPHAFTCYHMLQNAFWKESKRCCVYCSVKDNSAHLS